MRNRPAPILAILLGLNTVAAQGPESHDSIAVARYVAAVAALGDLSGQVVVASGDRLLFRGSYGYADHATKRLMTDSTPILVASLAKPFTGITVRTLGRKGSIDLAAPLTTVLPELPDANRFTLALLLQHRAGLPHRVTTPAEEAVPIGFPEMLARAARAPRLAPPDSARIYSSVGYTLVAAAIERMTGRSLSAHIEEIMLVPAGTRHTTPVATAAWSLNNVRALSAMPHPAGPRPAPVKDYQFLTGAGSMWSTADDLLRVVRSIVRGTFGPEEREGFIGNGTNVGNGFSNGFRATWRYDASDDLTIVIVSNYFTGSIDLLVENLPRVARGEAVEAPQSPYPTLVRLDRDTEQGFEGRYQLGEGFVSALQFGSDGVAVFGEYGLWPMGADLFFAPQDYQVVRAERDTAGRVVAMQWGEPGRGPRFLRMPSR